MSQPNVSSQVMYELAITALSDAVDRKTAFQDEIRGMKRKVAQLRDYITSANRQLASEVIPDLHHEICLANSVLAKHEIAEITGLGVRHIERILEQHNLLKLDDLD